MPKYTNTTKGSLDFATGGTPSDPEFTSFKAGETKSVELNTQLPAVAGALLAGALVADTPAAKRAAAKAEKAETLSAS